MIQLVYTCGGSPLDFIGTSGYVSDGNFVLAFHPLTGQIMGSSYITEPTYTDSSWSQYAGTAIPLDIYIYGDTDTDIGIVPIFKLWRDNGDIINLYINYYDCDYSEETYSNNMLSIVGQCIDMSIPECYSSPLIDNDDGYCSGISSFSDCGLTTCIDECDYVYGCNDLNACNYDSGVDADNGSCVYPDCTGICYGSSFLDECGICNGDSDGSDCNNDGVPDDCEEVYTAGLEEGILLGGQSGDANGDGTLDVLDIVYFVDLIINP